MSLFPNTGERDNKPGALERAVAELEMRRLIVGTLAVSYFSQTAEIREPVRESLKDSMSVTVRHSEPK